MSTLPILEELIDEKNRLKQQRETIKKKIEQLEDELWGCKTALKETKEKIGCVKTSYSLEKVLSWLRITEELKQDLKQNIGNVRIFLESDLSSSMFTIEYMYDGERIRYWASVRPDEWYPKTHLCLKSTEHTINVIETFHPFKYGTLHQIGSLEKHLNRVQPNIMADSRLTLAALLSGYFFFMFFKQFKGGRYDRTFNGLSEFSKVAVLEPNGDPHEIYSSYQF